MVFGLVGKGTVARTLDLGLMEQEKWNNADRTVGLMHHPFQTLGVFLLQHHIPHKFQANWKEDTAFHHPECEKSLQERAEHPGRALTPESQNIKES